MDLLNWVESVKYTTALLIDKNIKKLAEIFDKCVMARKCQVLMSSVKILQKSAKLSAHLSLF